jgi:lipopolysaccharide transport system ATP-binding protein
VTRVRARGIGVRFIFDRQERPVTPAAARLRRHCTVTWGLRGVSFEIGPGDRVALVGPNGAGKTTVLRTVAGVYEPDEGSVEVSGRIGALLGVNAGLLPRLTGRENALLLGVLAGIPPAEMRRSLDAVGERAKLGREYERPASSYSMGMKARLGFAVIEHAQPELLLLDEVHEALDDEFREYLVAFASGVAAAGGIVVAAGHDLRELEELCARAIRLEDGSVAADGPFERITVRRAAQRTL